MKEGFDSAPGVVLEALKVADTNERLFLDQEVQAKQTRADLLKREWLVRCQQAERELREAEIKLLTFDLKLITERLRVCEQNLKKTISWYTPLEELLDMPVMGVNADDFIATATSREGMLVDKHSSKQLWLDVWLDVDNYWSHPSECREHCTREHCAVVVLDVLGDDTLRPQVIFSYDALFTDTRPLFEGSDAPMPVGSAARMDIGFIGRLMENMPFWKTEPVYETLVVDRRKTGPRNNSSFSGYLEVYDHKGERKSLESHKDKGSFYPNRLGSWVADYD